MTEIKLTLKPLDFAARAFRALPQQIATKKVAMNAVLARRLFPAERETLSQMSLSSLLYHALIGNSAAAD